MLRKRRSTFWVVSTHVLTTGMAIPAVAALVAAAIIWFGGLRDPLAVLSIQAGCAVVGYVGGTYYSLSYLKRTANHENWTDCTTPSVIAFAICAILGFAWSVTQLTEPNAASIGVLGICYALMIVVFWKITASGFRHMAERSTEVGDLKKSPNYVGKSHTKRAVFGRLVGVCIGLTVGFVVGLAVAIYLDGPGWETRLIIASVVGGIGAFLGLISGPPRW